MSGDGGLEHDVDMMHLVVVWSLCINISIMVSSDGRNNSVSVEGRQAWPKPDRLKRDHGNYLKTEVTDH